MPWKRKNLNLRLQLKVGKESIKQNEQVKEEMLKTLQAALQPNASQEDLKAALKAYLVRYSDSSSEHEDSAENHMGHIQRLLTPTKATKMVLWVLNQDDDFFKPVLSPNDSLFSIMAQRD